MKGKGDNMEKFQDSQYYVWNKGNGEPKKIHPTLELAREESNRLAKTNPGMEIFIVRVVESVIYNESPFRYKHFCKR